jgi:cytochrome c biogenesis protein CcdA
MIATVVETKELLQSVAASLIAGIGVTAVFSIVILGITRSADMARDERPLLAAAAGALALLAGLVVAAAIAFGIVVMTQK